MSNAKEKLKTGASASAGAALGSAAGILASMYGAEAHAANVQPVEVAPEEIEVPTDVQAEVVEQPVDDDTQVEVVSASSQQEAQSYNVSNEATIQPEVQVLGYDTIPGPVGTPVQAALVSIDGQQMVVADLDNDGIADIVCADLNGNGMLDNGEVEDITAYQMQMNQFEAALEPDNNFYAQTAYDPDYTNDANVDTYMA